MPEPLSAAVTLTLVGYAAVQAAARPSSAVSPEAQAVRRSASALARSAEQSVALFGNKATAIAQVCALAAECRQPGWDGDAAEPVSWAATSRVLDLIRALPEAISMPEFAPEPDGSISLDWIQSRYRLFSLSVGVTNRMAYAWLDGTDRGHAVARFDGGKLPAMVLEGIRQILGHDAPALRTA